MENALKSNYMIILNTLLHHTIPVQEIWEQNY